MSEEDIEKWAQEGRSKETATETKTTEQDPIPKQEKKAVEPPPNDSSDEDEKYNNDDFEKALLQIGLLKIKDGKLTFDANIPPYTTESGGIIMARVSDAVAEGEPPKKRRKQSHPEPDQV